MSDERRQYPRRAGPFEGEWHDASGTREARLLFLSPSGCFVDSDRTPDTGRRLSVTVIVEGTRFTIPAEVVYRDLIRGFGVRFLPSDQARALALVMGVPIVP